ncbi:MAG: EcsC family protein [Verrucomicrobia bacterium]|nr:EcsC family protein [Prolixibacteraceae bacterium]
MDFYQQQIRSELTVWQNQMLRRPTVMNWLSKEVQTKVNTWIPEKVHKAITATIKQMIRGVLFGATHTTAKPLAGQTLREREAAIEQRIEKYKTTAAVEGGITGAGGFLLGLADFPILIGIKLKLLFDIASMYGFNVDDYKERVYILHIFELAFSSHQHRKNVYLKMVNWDHRIKELPEDIHQFDWRNFQQEYRDYIDLAKMAQLIPIIGAPVGVVVNSRLIKKLGHTAMNAYRMRLMEGTKMEVLKD